MANNCVLRIGIANNNNLTNEQLDVMKGEIGRIYGQIGITVDFSSKNNAHYFLSINAVGNLYKPDNLAAVGITYGSQDGSTITNNGRVFVDRLIAGAGSNFVSKYYFNQEPNRFLGIGLGRAGAHEIGHYILQQLNDSPNYFGVMKDSFGSTDWFDESQGTRDLWTFNDEQAKAIRMRVCPPETTAAIDR